jgi:iron(III) transport system permease protein
MNADVRRFLSGLAPLVVAAAIAAPLLVVLASVIAPAAGTSAHVWSTTGPLYLANTAALALMVAAGALALGVPTAALAAITEFPGRRFLAVALALPLAVPAYIAAYAYGDLAGPFGPIAAVFGAAPDVKSLPGAAFVLTLANYPYVYLAARASFDSRSGALLEAARAQGSSPARAVLSVLAPAGRAAIMGGLALALMETVADYGVADYAGVPTLSVGVFRTWRGLGDLVAASQIAASLLLAAMLLVLMEDLSRRSLGADSPRAIRAFARLRLSSRHAAPAIFLCAVPPFLGFALPVATLLAKAMEGRGGRDLVAAAADTFLIALAGAALAVMAGGALALSARGSASPPRRALMRVATLGYALPGAVVALATVAAAAFLGVGLASGLTALLYAYVVRFATAAFNTIDGGLKQIHPMTEEAARMLGAGLPRIVRRLFLPAARPAVAAGALIVFIDICRELPATLLLRPFNFETLATSVYRLASDERLAEAAPAALLLIALSLAPVLWVNALGRRA